MKVIHRYEEKSLRNLKKNEDADCTKCSFAEKTPDIEGGYVWLCHAALYDIETLSCFVPKASPDCLEAVRWSAKALKALRPVSREQVEKVWRGEWVEKPYSTKSERNRVINCKKHICSVCNKSNGRKKNNFCPSCGAPMTDEAVEMVMERMEALHDTEN